MLDWFYPRTIEKISSKYNGEIKVVKSRSRYSVWAGGFEQSGEMVHRLWRKALVSMTGSDPVRIKMVLILGLGCGVAARLAAERFPQTKIIGVEVDPAMINLGKKYFGLGNISNLEIKRANVLQSINGLKSFPKYDLILVDLYRGGEMPERIRNKNFLRKINTVLARNGIAIFNYLHFRKTEKEKREFLQEISKYFRGIRVSEEKYNTLIFCRKTG